MQQHSPTPWNCGTSPHPCGIVRDGRNNPVADCRYREPHDDLTKERIEANAAHIVKCVNERDALVEALQVAERTLRWAAQEANGRVKREIVGGWIHHAEQARAALALAGAE